VTHQRLILLGGLSFAKGWLGLPSAAAPESRCAGPFGRGGASLLLLSLATLFTGCASNKSHAPSTPPAPGQRVSLVSHDPNVPPPSYKPAKASQTAQTPTPTPASSSPQSPATAKAQPEAPIIGPTVTGLLQYDATFDAAVEILRGYGFSIDRQDYRFGLVTTRPLVSPTILEPWRTTNTSPGQMAQGTLNTQRRIVRVALKPAPGSTPATPKYQLTVQVTLIKLQQPLKHLNGSTSGFSIVSHYSSVPAEWKEDGIPRAYWIPDGADPLLAQRVIDDIAKRANLK
jgi:hypothetical protein